MQFNKLATVVWYSDRNELIQVKTFHQIMHLSMEAETGKQARDDAAKSGVVCASTAISNSTDSSKFPR